MSVSEKDGFVSQVCNEAQGVLPSIEHRNLPSSVIFFPKWQSFPKPTTTVYGKIKLLAIF